MKALLRTRCGCTKPFTTTFPPPPVVVVPLLYHDGLGPFEPTDWGEAAKPVPTRRFLLDHGYGGDPCSTALYWEEE